MYIETLPPTFIVRPPTLDDLQPIVRLIQAYDLAVDGETMFTEEDMQHDWRRPGIHLETDGWVVVAPATEAGPEDLPASDGLIVGYQELWDRAGHTVLVGDGYVHPRFNGRGIGTTMLRLLETRARQHIPLAPPERRVFLRNGVAGADQEAYRLHENEGYQATRYMWVMEAQLSAPPPAPDWPAGFRIANLAPGQERQVFDAFEEAFHDHWGYTPWNWDIWRERNLESKSFDPGLWFLAWDGDQLAGGLFGHYRGEIGWVNQLAVRRPWRRHGLGLALLLHAFAEFYQRGTPTIRLGVDASSPTGATRVYQRAGMQVHHQAVVYEKELRPGREGDPEGASYE